MINLQADQRRTTLHTATKASHLVAVPGHLSMVVNPRMARLIIAAGLGLPGNLRVVSGTPGSDLAIAWNEAVAAVDYIVQIHDNTGLRYEFTTSGLGFTYTTAMQTNDGGIKRTYTIKVAAHNPAVGRSEYAELVVTNAAPATPVGLRVVEQYTNFIVSCENAVEGDYAGMIVWAGASSGFAVNDGSKVYDDAAQSAVILWPTATPNAYFRVARYDLFAVTHGKVDLNISTEFAGTLLPTNAIPTVDVLPATTYLGNDVVFYTGNDSLYTWDTSLDPDAYVRAAPLVVADQIYSIDLKAMSADIGELTLGQMNLDASGWIRGGQSAYATGTGFFLGYSGGTYKFSIGDTNKYFRWDGSTLAITGGALDVGTYGHVRGGQTDYNTGTGFYLGYSGGGHKFSIGSPTGDYLTWDGSNLAMQMKSGSLNIRTPGVTVKTGTYSRTGTTVTVSCNSHGYAVDKWVTLDFTSGAATDGEFQVVTSSTNSFTVTHGTSGTTSGNVTISGGQRMEIKSNVIKVYDENGALRVKMGDLSA